MALRARCGCCPGVACSLVSLSWANLRACVEKAVGLASGIQLGWGTELEVVPPAREGPEEVVARPDLAGPAGCE